MRPKAFLVIIIIAVMPLVLSSVATPFPETVRTFSYQTLKPVFQTSDFVSDNFKGLFTKAKDFLSVHKQNQELKNQIRDLKMEVAELKEENKKIERLAQILPFLDQGPRSMVYSQIIFRGMSFWDQTVIIDKGSKQGIQKDMPVITHMGLVGKVTGSAPSTASVILLTDHSSRVGALGQESRDIGLLCGEGVKLLRMIYLDLSSTIKIGDTIVTSGMGGVFPKGIPVGKVETVAKDKDGLHLYALVRPFVDFSKLEEVLCLLKQRGELRYSQSS